MDFGSKLLVAALCCFVAFGCSGRPLEDAQVYGVYVWSDSQAVDLIILDSTRTYTHMFWTQTEGNQEYSGDWSLLWEDGQDMIMFLDFGLYGSDFPSQKGALRTGIHIPLAGAVRISRSPDEGQFYDRVSGGPEDGTRIFDSLVGERK